MPIDNATARELATHVYHATVATAFSQTSNSCIGYVAMWLRKRSRNKGFFTDANNKFQKFVRPDGVTIFEDQDDDRIDLKSANKAQMYQWLMHKSSAVEVNYIEQGSKQQVKALEFVGSRAGFVSNKAWDARGLTDFISALALNKQLASVGVGFDEKAHAIGFDCSLRDAAYFDPNLGEFIFPNVSNLVKWWRFCHKYERGPNDNVPAFSTWKSIRDGRFTANVFKRIRS
jgi:hypothetical protein